MERLSPVLVTRYFRVDTSSIYTIPNIRGLNENILRTCTGIDERRYRKVALF